MKSTVKFIAEEVEAGRGNRLLDVTAEFVEKGFYSQEKGKALSDTIRSIMHLHELLDDSDQAE